MAAAPAAAPLAGNAPGSTAFAPSAAAVARDRARRAMLAGLRTGPRSWIEHLANWPYSRLIDGWLLMVAGLGLVYWGGSAVGFGALLDAGTPMQGDLRGLLSALYFSVVTATSVGFGDVVPTGPLRLFAVLEGAAGLLLFGCIVSKLVSQRQDVLVRETHLIAFEERLGRVRTDLHFVLSELQAIALETEAHGMRVDDRLLARLESTTMMLAGELRTIHDLLYRPHQTPDEAMLESLLASLAASMRELCDLLTLAPRAQDRSELLTNTLASVRTLAGEVCGDCVPRQYAPHLKVWMDRIQTHARALAPSE